MTVVATPASPAPLSLPRDEDRWEAVLRRDARADGDFVYSVLTTRVYCRPSCPSRRARRENVAFHASCEAAERAGFRPCKRCRPNEAASVERRAAIAAAACARIDEAERPPTLEALAADAGLSRFHFHRLFTEIVGVTPKAYAAERRAGRVRDELARGGGIAQAIYGAGFNSSGRFYAAAPKFLGMAPSEFRAEGAGAAIRFAVGQCSLGAILVAATAKGVCAILLGDDPHALTRDLQDRFSNARLIGGDEGFEAIVAQAVGLVERPSQALELPLDVRGTAFQQRVWRALRDIPFGATASYAQIAARIGAPKAARAVAGACSANPVAVAIPCHRVVGADGALSGYRWGVERKRALLARERSS